MGDNWKPASGIPDREFEDLKRLVAQLHERPGRITRLKIERSMTLHNVMETTLTVTLQEDESHG